MPIVTALQDFEFDGRHIKAGDRPDFIPPAHCLAYARAGKVSLDKSLALQSKPKRRYRRRDMQAESE